MSFGIDIKHSTTYTAGIPQKNYPDAKKIHNELIAETFSTGSSDESSYLPEHSASSLVSGIELRSPDQGLSEELAAQVVSDLKSLIVQWTTLPLGFLEILVEVVMEAYKNALTATSSLKSGLALIQRDMASNVADSMREQGHMQLYGAIVSGGTTIVASSIAARQTVRGLNSQVAAASNPDELSRKVQMANAEKTVASGRWIDATGHSVSTAGKGITDNLTANAKAKQTMGEQDTGVAQKTLESTHQQIENVKEFKDSAMKMIQLVIENDARARDAAARI